MAMAMRRANQKDLAQLKAILEAQASDVIRRERLSWHDRRC
jgi:hypothetical protein